MFVCLKCVQATFQSHLRDYCGGLLWKAMLKSLIKSEKNKLSDGKRGVNQRATKKRDTEAAQGPQEMQIEKIFSGPF